MTSPLLGAFGTIGITELLVLGLCCMVPLAVICIVLVVIGISKPQNRNGQ